jgi:hypothetical protein
LGWTTGGMSVAITLCDKTKHERRENKRDHSLFHRSEVELLPRLIQFKAPVFLQFLACSFFRDRTIRLTHKESVRPDETRLIIVQVF